MVPEAPFEQTPAGLVPTGPGWFVLNARDARWIERPGRGRNAPLTGWMTHEADSWFPHLGVNVVVLDPGEPIGMYHWEDDAEDFLVLRGAATLIVQGEERPLRQWDFVHCPPRTAHMIVGAGSGPCVIVATSSRANQAGRWGEYVPDETAARYGASVEAATSDTTVAYARFAPSRPVAYEDGWLPG